MVTMANTSLTPLHSVVSNPFNPSTSSNIRHKSQSIKQSLFHHSHSRCTADYDYATVSLKKWCGCDTFMKMGCNCTNVVILQLSILLINIVAAFRGMHVSPAKHSYAWLPRKCDYRTDTQTNGRTDRRRTKWSLCEAMLRRRHKMYATMTTVVIMAYFLSLKLKVAEWSNASRFQWRQRDYSTTFLNATTSHSVVIWFFPAIMIILW